MWFYHHFGYFKYKTIEEFNQAYKQLFVEQIIPTIPEGLSATVYTQLSDVEDEVNGLITYDRKVIKVDVEKIKYLNSLIKYLD